MAKDRTHAIIWRDTERDLLLIDAPWTKLLASDTHPDRGGTNQGFRDMEAAWQKVMRARGWKP